MLPVSGYDKGRPRVGNLFLIVPWRSRVRTHWHTESMFASRCAFHLALVHWYVLVIVFRRSFLKGSTTLSALRPLEVHAPEGVKAVPRPTLTQLDPPHPPNSATL